MSYKVFVLPCCKFPMQVRKVKLLFDVWQGLTMIQNSSFTFQCKVLAAVRNTPSSRERLLIESMKIRNRWPFQVVPDSLPIRLVDSPRVTGVGLAIFVT